MAVSEQTGRIARLAKHTHILTKLGLQNRSQIAVWANQLGHPRSVEASPL